MRLDKACEQRLPKGATALRTLDGIFIAVAHSDVDQFPTADSIFK